MRKTHQNKQPKRHSLKTILFKLLTAILIFGGMIAITISLFLPFSSAKESMKNLLATLPDATSYPDTGLTNGELLHLSSWDLIQFYNNKGNILLLILLPLLRATAIATLLYTVFLYFKKISKHQMIANLVIVPLFVLIHFLSAASRIFPNASTGYQAGIAPYLGYAGIILSMLGSFLILRSHQKTQIAKKSLSEL